MSLRIKTLLTLGTITLSLLLALYIAAELIVPPNFAALERQHVETDLLQTDAVLRNEAAALALTAQDWAAWDETYQFVEDGNQEYVRANLPDQTFVDLHLNVMVFIQGSGRVVYGRQFHPAGGTAGRLPASLEPYLQAPGPFLPAGGQPRATHGLLALPDGPLLVAIHPIVRSDDRGPARGILILGRWLDAAEIARLSQLLHHPFRLVPLDAPLPADAQAGLAELSPERPALVQPLDNTRIAGYRLLPDVTGAPGVLIAVEQGRPMMQQGRAALGTLALALTVAGMGFGVAALLVLERLVLQRLARVEADVHRVRGDSDATARITVTGQDELDRLGIALNRTLDALQGAQQQLRASEARYRAVVEDQTELICRWRPDRTLTFANSAYRRAFAALHPPERHLVPAAVVAEDRERAAAHLAQLNSQAGSATLEVRVALPDGRVRWQQWVDRPIVDEAGQLVEIQSVGRDITELKRAEEEHLLMERRMLEAQRLESLGTLASGAAHDFNNLLAIILGSSGLVVDALPAASTLRPMLERIEYAARRAADLTEQLLAYGGRGRMMIQPLDLNSLVADLEPLLAASVARSSAITYQLAPRPLAVVADGGQIRQVVMNLVLNAAEAIGYSEGQITVATSRQEIGRAELDGALLGSQRAPGRYVCLDVCDTGAGIDPATLPQIFEPFFTTKLGGHGLGLAAVLGIVRAHEGAIWVKSAPGEGAAFRVLLPETERPLPIEWAAEAERGPWRGQGTILIVDDEPAVGETTAAMLRQIGFTARLAQTGEEGLRIFHDDPFGTVCVLLDLTVLQQGGADLLTGLRVLRPHVPVIVMSGFDRAYVLAELGAETAEVLSKPFDAETLREVLRAVIEEA
jgi:PAS domain S-box-containing protein